MDNPLVQADPGLFIWTILTFLVLLGLLTKFAWKPLLAALEERRATIAKALDDSQRAKEEYERAKQESGQVLARTRVEAEAIMARTRADADQFREEMRQKAIVDAGAIAKRAEREIQMEANRAVGQLRREAADLSVDIATKLLHRNITKADNQALIDDTLKQLGPIEH
jgi:F-type H+-transporting ATPase subunit b